MARVIARVQLEGHKKEYVFTELGVDQIIALAQDQDLFKGIEQGKGAEQLKSLEQKAAELLPQFSNLTLDDIMHMAPSEIKTLWDDGFAEANSVFFHTWRRVGLDQMLEQLRAAVVNDLTTILTASYLNQPAGLSKVGMQTP